MSEKIKPYKHLHSVSVRVIYKYKDGASNKAKSTKKAKELGMRKGASIGTTAIMNFSFTKKNKDFGWEEYVGYLDDMLNYPNKTIEIKGAPNTPESKPKNLDKFMEEDG